MPAILLRRFMVRELPPPRCPVSPLVFRTVASQRSRQLQAGLMKAAPPNTTCPATTTCTDDHRIRRSHPGGPCSPDARSFSEDGALRADDRHRPCDMRRRGMQPRCEDGSNNKEKNNDTTTMPTAPEIKTQCDYTPHLAQSPHDSMTQDGTSVRRRKHSAIKHALHP